MHFSRLSGMRPATTLSEWQLQAVLHKAKLTQYFETFISQVNGNKPKKIAEKFKEIEWK